MDGTLLDLHFDSHFWLEHLPRIFAEKNELNDQQVNEILAPLFRDHAGTLNWYCVEFWSDALDLDIMRHKQEVAGKIAYRPQAQGFLQRCRQQVSDLRLITNAHRDVLEMKIQHTRLDQYFDQMICSHELGAAKEQASFWQRLRQHRDFDPAQTLFIDDSETVLDAASDYGVKYLFSIAQPDSRSPRSEVSKYPMLTSFENEATASVE